MDLHPTPFPGKRRQATDPTAKPKSGDRTKTSKKATQHLIAPAHTRPKRAFGIARSTNIPIEKPTTKPLSTKSCKPWKPSGAPLNPAVTKPAKVESNKIKKDQHVHFQDPTAAALAEIVSSGKSEKEDALCTPMRLINPAAAAVSTPYLSAQNCSKCRLDRLESATYWLGQIRLAESVAKHFVSAAFFRLALECRAQPFHKLQGELRQYVARHRGKSVESLWSDLCKAYGIPKDQTNVDFCNIGKTNTLLDEMEAVRFKDELGCKTFRECDDAHKVLVELSDNGQIEHSDAPAEPSCGQQQDGMNSNEDQATTTPDIESNSEDQNGQQQYGTNINEDQAMKTPDIESNSENQNEQQQDGVNSNEDQATKNPDIESNREDQIEQHDDSQQVLIELLDTKTAEPKDLSGEKVAARSVGSSCRTPGSGDSSNSRETSNRIPGKPKFSRSVGAQKEKCKTRIKGRAAGKSTSSTSSVGCKSGEVGEDTKANQRT
ncbi:uncharacterized protein [Typha latifolia]|uniref:uncharacterized protein n=1 Tax=Typha latifolia TaxID=4733 RepID=UPI003C2D747B